MDFPRGPKSNDALTEMNRGARNWQASMTYSGAARANSFCFDLDLNRAVEHSSVYDSIRINQRALDSSYMSYSPYVSSYDYGAPLNEAGQITPKY